MRESLFGKYVALFFPKLQRLIEKVNGRRTNLTYLHKGDNAMLRMEYSPDNKWESTTVNTTYVAADFVALDSELPIKSRSTIAASQGKLPKIGMAKILKESDINQLNIMEAQGGNAQQIAQRLANYSVACSVGIDERNEYNFLKALSEGYVAIEDADNPNALLRLNFNYLPQNIFGATVKGEIDLYDIKRVIDAADADGNSIIKILIAKTTYDALRQTRAARELYASYVGVTYGSDDTLAVPSASKFNEAFADDNNGIQFVVVNRSIITERNGVKTVEKPWAKNRIIFVCNDIVGTLVYGRLAEQTNPVQHVTYATVDTYKLISEYGEVNPLREITSGQAFCAPIIEDVDQIYVLDINEGEEVDTDAEDSDSDDTTVTVFDNTYTKSDFVGAYNTVTGASLAEDASDDEIIAAVNQLSKAAQKRLQTEAESAIVSE